MEFWNPFFATRRDTSPDPSGPTVRGETGVFVRREVSGVRKGRVTRQRVRYRSLAVRKPKELRTATESLSVANRTLYPPPHTKKGLSYSLGESWVL